MPKILTFNNVKKWAKRQNIEVDKGRKSTEYVWWDYNDHSMQGVGYSVLELYEDIVSDMVQKGKRPKPL